MTLRAPWPAERVCAVRLSHGADAAELLIGQILADRAGTNLFMCLQDGVRKLLCLVMRHIQHVKSKPLSRLASNARKAGKLLN